MDVGGAGLDIDISVGPDIGVGTAPVGVRRFIPLHGVVGFLPKSGDERLAAPPGRGKAAEGRVVGGHKGPVVEQAVADLRRGRNPGGGDGAGQGGRIFRGDSPEVEQGADVPAHTLTEAQQHGVGAGGQGDAVFLILDQGGPEGIEAAPAEEAGDIDELGVALELVLFFQALHRLLLRREVEAAHPCHRGGFERLIGVERGDGLAERLIQRHAKCLHGRHVKQVDDGLGFSAEFREEIAMPLFVEFNVGEAASLRAADEVMVRVAAVTRRRAEASDIDRWIARSKDRSPQLQIHLGVE